MARRPPAARTAFGPMFVTAIEQYTPSAHRIVHDPFASRMLPTALRLPALAGRWHGVRRRAETASDRRAPGVWAGVLCRKRYARDRVDEALAAGISQIVVLGAGLDTLAYQVARPGVTVFEVDMPEIVIFKRERLRVIFGRVPAGVELAPVRFETDGLAASLEARGFHEDAPAMFLWEAVTQYLTEDAVRRTLTFLSNAAPGSRLAFTFVRKDFFTGANYYGAEALHRDFVRRGIWRFALDPSDVDGLMREYGWVEREQAGPAEYAVNYLRPAGRDLAASEIERFAYAEKS